MDLPTVSVVLPTCNRPHFLLEAAAGVAAQTSPPAELLIINDGMPPPLVRPLHALARHADLPLQILPGPRRGPAAARNVGLRAAAGDLIALLDDDDLWLPHKLAWQIIWFGRRPDLGLLGSGYLPAEAPPSLKVPRRGMPRRLRAISRAALMRANRLATSTVVLRRACVDGFGLFDESLPLAQDWDLWLRMSARWRMAAVPAPLVIYRLHAGQRSSQQAAMRSCEAEVIGRALCSHAGERKLGPLARRRLAWAHCRLGRLLLRQGNLQRAVSELRKSLSYSPLQPLALTALGRCALGRRAVVGAPRP